MREANSGSLYYKGQSMHPTFKVSDILRAAPYNGEKIRRGDVVIFNSPKDRGKVVHRVVFVNADGIRTRGDNSGKADPWILKDADILGRVVSVNRQNGTFKVYGGPIGLLRVNLLKIKSVLKKGAYRVLEPSYRRLSKKGIFNQRLPYGKGVRILIFDRPAGKEMQVLVKDQLVARKNFVNKRGYVKWPFRPLINDIFERNFP
ncbi:MAG: S26 family signal peptidase [Candidatus Omnitrophica bacterium]|nr:S26 family signal peptidase [Candidatus Omnitrophota bacterium]